MEKDKYNGVYMNYPLSKKNKERFALLRRDNLFHSKEKNITLKKGYDFPLVKAVIDTKKLGRFLSSLELQVGLLDNFAFLPLSTEKYALFKIVKTERSITLNKEYYKFILVGIIIKNTYNIISIEHPEFPIELQRPFNEHQSDLDLSFICDGKFFKIEFVSPSSVRDGIFINHCLHNGFVYFK